MPRSNQLRLENEERRICWPDPDATCLEGGCVYCNENRFRKVSTIKRYAEKAGVLPNRGTGEKDATEAFNYGFSRNWNNAEVRYRG
jgi:hypothetical protein